MLFSVTADASADASTLHELATLALHHGNPGTPPE